MHTSHKWSSRYNTTRMESQTFSNTFLESVNQISDSCVSKDNNISNLRSETL